LKNDYVLIDDSGIPRGIVALVAFTREFPGASQSQTPVEKLGSFNIFFEICMNALRKEVTFLNFDPEHCNQFIFYGIF